MNIIEQTDTILKIQLNIRQSLVVIVIIPMLSMLLGLGMVFGGVTDGDVFVISTGVFFVLGSFFLLITTRAREIYTFDKHRHKLLITSRGIFGTDVKEYWLHEILGARLERKQYDYHIVLLLLSQETVQLCHSEDKARMQAIGYQLYTFMRWDEDMYHELFLVTDE
jgi:hypothetical protein